MSDKLYWLLNYHHIFCSSCSVHWPLLARNEESIRYKSVARQHKGSTARRVAGQKTVAEEQIIPSTVARQHIGSTAMRVAGQKTIAEQQIIPSTVARQHIGSTARRVAGQKIVAGQQIIPSTVAGQKIVAGQQLIPSTLAGHEKGSTTARRKTGRIQGSSTKIENDQVRIKTGKLGQNWAKLEIN